MQNIFNSFFIYLFLAHFNNIELYSANQQKESFMEDKIKYIEQQIKSKKFNIRAVCRNSGVSNATIYKINQGHGSNVRPYIIDTLYTYFKNIGE